MFLFCICMIPYAPPDLKPDSLPRTKVYILFIPGGLFLRMIPLYAPVSQNTHFHLNAYFSENTHSLYFSKNHANLSSIKIRVSRLAAMAADCKSAGLSYVGSSPTWPTKQNRAASLWKPPDINIIPHLFSPVHSQFLQLFAVNLMEHPILQFS